MKYLTYLSETKINMLYGQIPNEGESEEMSVGVDLKLLKMQKTRKTATAKSISGKLLSIESKLREAGMVADIFSEKPYIQGTLPMRAGGYGFRESPIAFWGADGLQDGTVVSLAGSRYHVLGEQRGVEAHSHSLTDEMTVWFLQNLQEQFPAEDHERAGAELYDPSCADLTDYDIANGAYLAATQMQGPVQKLGFLAKVLHRSKWPEGFRSERIKRIVLGSPLYVSLED